MTPAHPPTDATEAAVWAFEAAWTAGRRPDLTEFLPAPGAPHYADALLELACVELERLAAAGQPRPAADYLTRFPQLAADPGAVAALRRQEERAAAVTSRVPRPSDPPAPDWRAKIENVHHGYRAMPSAEREALSGTLEVADWLLAAGGPDPLPAPRAGETVLGFRLVRELGRGAFARVFLAEQVELSGRPVALKIGARLLDETHVLAQLQHSNVVPIYSAHRDGDRHALCMPFLGATTLADVIEQFRKGTGPGNALGSTLAARGPSTALAPGGGSSAPAPTAAPPSPVPSELQKLTHPRLVAWVGARLADGLAHAHGRGILHRDIKPANVLIADDGTPLLLDFNLSADVRVRGGVPAVLGGTIPYMSGEHLAAFRGGTLPVDARSDIFSLGAVLYEMLTGRLSFPPRTGALSEQVPKMIDDRRAGAPPMRGVPPALAAIVAKCLHPDPARRYQTAHALHEDLQRQFDDRPLRHTANPSLLERAGKFARRNAKGLLAAAVLALAAAGIAAGAAAVERSRQAARAGAVNELTAFREDARAAKLLLGLPRLEDATAGEERARAALARFGRPDAPALAHLEPAGRAEVSAAVPELYLLCARAVRVRALHTPDPAARAALLDEALELNARAAEQGGPALARAATLQRALLVKTAGRSSEAELLLAEGRALPPGPGGARWLEVGEAFAQGDFAGAERVLHEATEADPSDPALWAARGAAAEARARYAEAVRCYTVVIALAPDFWPARVWRGRAANDLGDHPAAESDLTRALERAPDHVPALLARGVARLGNGDPVGAEADLTRGLELGSRETRVYFIRARAREARGDAAGAAADRAEGLRRTPGDEWSFTSRGVHRLPADPAGALADFDAALALNPHAREAAQNKAAVLSDYLKPPKAEEAVAVLTQLIELSPESADAVIGRAVVLARLGKRDAAHTDAAAALKLDRSGGTLYRAGCVYALTSRTNPGDRAEAFRLVIAGLLAGFGAEFVAADDDLAPLRADAVEFARLLKLAAPAKK